MENQKIMCGYKISCINLEKNGKLKIVNGKDGNNSICFGTHCARNRITELKPL
jgi:hypothetical protein